VDFVQMREPRGLFLLGRAAAGGVEGDSWVDLLKPFSFCSTTRVVLNNFLVY